jgi:4-diphosphocytidyl-2-C-methyl-D-erythritol kinase
MNHSSWQRPARAKVNLALAVLGLRSDGYHQMESVMQTIDLADAVRIRPLRWGLRLSCYPTLNIPPDRNLAYRAAELFFRVTSLRGGAEIVIRKRIPIAAGLGGGSADAAATLILLNEAHGNPLSPMQLEELGGQLGSDVPFALRQGTAWVRGRGEQVTSFMHSSSFYLVLSKPVGAFLSTRDVYTRCQPKERSPNTMHAIVEALQSNDIAVMAGLLFNDLEETACQMLPGIATIKQELLQQGAVTALLSGSGPTVFGLFEQENEAVRVAQTLAAKGIWAVVTHPVLSANSRPRE